ncbi:hypothetical protein GCM10018980_18470 [Streptomyces capoamus]|uniref:Uncharacterized protein n=1 Tax=Streptomyces capoamus TaxID=68183 RepID=A0A919EU75_9ACTN|nr:hypothetical protein GCM10010501_32070 [Streptomyces libani subsp. rufus]GHG42580.1 hypothetical protein GCM10018980_18470 [Streptomyces capoamus]
MRTTASGPRPRPTGWLNATANVCAPDRPGCVDTPLGTPLAPASKRLAAVSPRLPPDRPGLPDDRVLGHWLARLVAHGSAASRAGVGNRVPQL